MMLAHDHKLHIARQIVEHHYAYLSTNTVSVRGYGSSLLQSGLTPHVHVELNWYVGMAQVPI